MALGFPLVRDAAAGELRATDMAKKALVKKQRGPQKFSVRAYTRCQRCGRPRAVFKVHALPSVFPASWRTWANCRG